jgi:hypothetical protein
MSVEPRLESLPDEGWLNWVPVAVDASEMERAEVGVPESAALSSTA